MEVLHSSYNLMEKLESLRLLNALILDDIIKEFAAIGILHNQVELLGRLYDLIKLDDVWMSNHL